MKKTLIILIVVIVVVITMNTYIKANIPFISQYLPCTYITDYTYSDYKDSKIKLNYKYESNSNKEVSMYDNPRINSLDDFSKMKNKENIEDIALYDTCIKEIKNLDGLKSITNLYLVNNRIENIENLEDLNNLTHLNLEGNPIETIENIENIRTDTSEKLIVSISGENLKYVTQESYDYIEDEDNNTEIQIWYEDKLGLPFSNFEGEDWVSEANLELI